MSDTQAEISQARTLMVKALEHLETELAKIRAGRANPAMLDGIRVDYYGSEMPLSQVSNINTPDARTIMIQPWEKKMIDPIEKAIIAANLGFNPSNNGEHVMINVPMLTEERRKDLVKSAHREAENARVGLRQARHKALDGIKKLQKDGLAEDLAKDAEGEVEKLIKTYSQKVDALVAAKEADVMKV
ncbi:MAG: ribosome recycling factor [Flavobacteriales bacterium]|nr:ribosome recycling factor [Flavobacteriales bacterium]